MHVGDLVVLDGSGSSDDQTPSETLDYFWSFDAIPFGSSVEIVGNGTSAPTFVADVPGDYLVRLVVFDEGNRASQPDFVLISSLNVPPTADAGMDQGAIVGSQVTLDGSGSSDADGDALEFSWSFAEIPLGSAAVLIDADTSSPSFVPDLPGAYIAELVVSDGRAENGPDSVTISAVTAEQFAELNAIDALNSAGSLPPTSVTTKGNQTALTQHLTQVIKALQSDDLDAATFKLNQAIVRTDGCALRGSPDTGTGPGPHPEKDYITDCNEQKAIYLLLTEALAALSP